MIGRSSFYRRCFSIPFKGAFLSTLFLFACGLSAEPNAMGTLCPPREQNSPRPELLVSVSVLSDKEVNDLFGRAVSRSYHVIQVVLADRPTTPPGMEFVVNDLHFCSGDGVPVPTTPPSVVIKLIQRKHNATTIIDQLRNQDVLVPRESGRGTFFVVEKRGLSLSNGSLPDDIWLVGAVSETSFQTKPLCCPDRPLK